MSPKNLTVPKKMQDRYNEITALTDAFALAHLNQEYADMCRAMTATLCRKRPSPLEGGQANSWAAGIMHAICTVNFAFDKSQTPHTSVPELSSGFGVGKSSPTTKSKAIRDLLHIGLMDPEWTLPSRMDDNPMAWYITVNGLILDARYVSRDLQAIAYAKGLIPYIPADRKQP